MYKPQYLHIVRATKSAYGNNIAYFKKTIVTHDGYKWGAPVKKENKSGRHFLGKIK